MQGVWHLALSVLQPCLLLIHIAPSHWWLAMQQCEPGIWQTMANHEQDFSCCNKMQEHCKKYSKTVQLIKWQKSKLGKSRKRNNNENWEDHDWVQGFFREQKNPPGSESGLCWGWALWERYWSCCQKHLGVDWQSIPRHCMHSCELHGMNQTMSLPSPNFVPGFSSRSDCRLHNI